MEYPLWGVSDLHMYHERVQLEWLLTNMVMETDTTVVDGHMNDDVFHMGWMVLFTLRLGHSVTRWGR